MLFASQALRALWGLRFRLALCYALFSAALLVTAGFFFRGTLKAIQQNQAEDRVNSDWNAVKGYLRFGDLGPYWFFDPYDPDEAYTVERLRRVYLLADAQGQRIQSSDGYEPIGIDSPGYIKDLVRQGPKARAIRGRTGSNGTPYLIRSGVVFDPSHRKYFLAVGAPVSTNNQILRDFTFRYSIMVSLLVFLSGLLGWFLAGRARHLDAQGKPA